MLTSRDTSEDIISKLFEGLKHQKFKITELNRLDTKMFVKAGHDFEFIMYNTVTFIIVQQTIFITSIKLAQICFIFPNH